MKFDDLTLFEFAAMIGAFVISGLIRGFNGGAGANFITAPVLAVIIGPRETVPIVLGLNFLSTFQLIPGALQHVNWREALPLGAAAGASIPLGAWVLFSVDEEVMRRVVAATAIMFSILVLSGLRYTGPRGPLVAAGAGTIAGTIGGAVTMGGPPVFLYLLSGGDSAASNRATFIFFGFILQAIAVVVFTLNGVVTQDTLLLGAVLFLPFVIAVRMGAVLFRRADEVLFRRVSLWFMVAISVGILLL